MFAKISEIWNFLPKTLKVFFYISISIILSEVLIELGNIQQVFIVRCLAQIINLGLVFIGEAVPAIKDRFSK